ncbi:YdcF family protein [Patescibacteria group bacterium]|nr:YdcF family protein [Patescibacteria group bacterium]
MDLREKFIILIDNEPLKKSDAIIVLEGDGFARLNRAAQLYKDGWTKLIVISGGLNAPKIGSYPAEMMKKELKKFKIPNKNIILEKKSQDTKEQAENIIKMATEKKWQRIILVASHFHQYRAFLTFLKEILKKKIYLEIVNAPASELPWFTKNKSGRRIDHLELEFEKINQYSKKGHLASYSEAIDYQRLKESK